MAGPGITIIKSHSPSRINLKACPSKPNILNRNEPKQTAQAKDVANYRLISQRFQTTVQKFSRPQSSTNYGSFQLVLV